MTAAWLCLARGSDRSTGSNDGYDDKLSEYYSWDSTVGNSKALAEDDVIVLWDSKVLLGVSVIEKILVVDDVEKNSNRCPTCRSNDVYRLKTGSHPFGCRGCHQPFDDPLVVKRRVTHYQARYAAAWVDLEGLFNAEELRTFTVKERSQLSLRELRWDALRAAIESRGRQAEMRIVGDGIETIAGGHGKAIVRVRKGQTRFRTRLLTTQGEICAFTGPAPALVLEAAHLYSFAKEGRHHDHGGLLLRSDVHRLFDLGHICVDPETGVLDLSAYLVKQPCYASLHGQAVHIALHADHRAWLARHWNSHRTSRA
ncbi:HNH endonuclease [Embleya sp. NPDC059237]|uniref:HNH endonuclease n=1 Tax=Embleya sp. NPDC059237 TaxID=3346784 RepID=UPI003673F685